MSAHETNDKALRGIDTVSTIKRCALQQAGAPVDFKVNFPTLCELSHVLSKSEAIRLSGHWQVQAVPLGTEFCPQAVTLNWIKVPECAHLQSALYPDQPYWGEHLRAINDQAWVYRRTFKLPERPYKRARLRFEGVDYFAEVWVNDDFAGRHEGNFAPFDLDVTHSLDTDTVTLTVLVSAPWDSPNPKGTYPTNHVIRGLVKGLYEHGEGVIPPSVNPIGIWRPVWLLLDDGISIDHICIRCDLDGSVHLRLRITNTTSDLWRGSLVLSVEADNHNGCGTHQHLPVTLPSGVQHLDYVLHIPDVHRWWPWDQGSPDLYRLDASLLDSQGQVIDVKQECFGVRTLRLERTPKRFTYWINERAMFIRGTSYIPSLYLSQRDLPL